ncbi:MAG: hypothetical protein MUO27_11045 [Sedimentisphaerales bacterium]|nr:hypothetical protein [Sedimentisphaerales bacterium]
MSWGKKTTVEDSRSVSIAFLKKHDYFCGCRSGGIVWKNYYGEETSSISIFVSTMDGDNYVRFQYTTTDRNTGEEVEYDYKVALTTTPCHFGGVRYWFICPLSGCGRRVGKLYKAPGSRYFGCRHCYDLSYESRNESHDGKFEILGGVLNLDKRIEKLYSQTKRWTYAGRPTRKARRIHALQQKMEAYDRILQTTGI